MRRVLIVEDEPDVQEVVAALLAFSQIEVERVGTAEEALHMLAENPNYAGVIIDIALPGMNGIDLLKTIRGNHAWQHLPCIAITAYHTSSVRHEAMSAGFDAYFSKPLDDRTFAQDVAQIIHA